MEEWPADATRVVVVTKAGVKVTANATAWESTHVSPWKATADMVSACAAAQSVSKCIVGDERASKGQSSGGEGHHLLQNELLHHHLLSIR
jgi:hypothetical protein